MNNVIQRRRRNDFETMFPFETDGLQKDVGQFHRAMGHPAPDFPAFEITDDLEDLLLKRADWLIEEAEELREAAKQRDLIGVLDALGDSAYFAVGGYVILGQDFGLFWRNIQDANMAKLGPDGKPVPHPTMPGKIGKPEGWVAPEARHEALLEEVQYAVKLEGLARQIAYARLRGEDTPLSIAASEGVTLQALQLAMERAEIIYKSKQAEVLYRQMVDSLPDVPLPVPDAD